MNEIRLRPDALYLDPTNPRLANKRFSVADQHDILQWLWRNMAVNELVDSILANGYWDHDKIFATKENDCMVVVEGNRRLVAVKILLDADLRRKLGIRLPPGEPSDHVLQTMHELPVIQATREELWSYVGFKHVNGPQAWDSIGKAEYVFRVRRDTKLSLSKIASSIGDRHATVERLHRGYVVLQQAEKYVDFKRTDTQHIRFPFSHLWTALGYLSVREYLGTDITRLADENPVPRDRLPQLKNFMSWLFGSVSKQVEAKIRRQNPDLRHLAQALKTAKGIDLLENGASPLEASNATLGDAQLFRSALTKAERNTKEAMQFVSTGFGGEVDLMETASDLLKVARNLKSTMDRNATNAHSDNRQFSQ